MAIPVVLLSMGGELTGVTRAIGQQASNWTQLVLATPVVLWAGWPLLVRSWRSVATRNLNLFTNKLDQAREDTFYADLVKCRRAGRRG